MQMNEYRPDFHMPYSALMQLGDTAVLLAQRDTAELSFYGINEEYINLLKQKTSALKNMPTDEELLAGVSIGTAKKNDTADAIRTAVRSIMIRAKIVYGYNSAAYNNFGVKGLDRMNDNELLRCAKRVARIAEENLTALSEKGLTQEEITALYNRTQDYDYTIDAKDIAVSRRDRASAQRITIANELYELIKEVFDYGKDYWYSRQEAKYNDYIIYEHKG